MPVSSAINNFLVWRERQQARQNHERVDMEETNNNNDHPLQEEQREERMTQQSSSRAAEVSLVDSASSEEEDGDIENQRTSPLETEASTTRSTRGRSSSRRTNLTLADLEEERELARRRTSGCVLIAAFILFRLWIQAVATGDFGLLLLCLLGTSWTARFIRANREREEELDRLIIEYNENGDGSGEISRNDVRMLSFQAQLALAIIESQRQMMQGGFGSPDGPGATPGVSDEAMEHWDKFEFKANLGLPGQSSKHWSDNSADEEPHCSICLCEYEEKETLVCLPCKHVYHHDCLASWCKNHIRCPLCNFDLESVTEASD